MNYTASYWSKDRFWFRILGYGITGKNILKHRLMFSEREGYSKRLQIGNWSFRILKPNKF